MAHSRRQLLEYVVEVYDRRERPVSADELATALAADPERVRECLADFRNCALVVRVGPSSYRPTTTARELLALDVEGKDLLIVDAGSGDSDEGPCGGR